MAATSKLQIIIDVIADRHGDTDKLSGKLSKLVGTLGSVAGAFGIVAGAAAAGWAAFKKGAELELVKDQFENVAESIGLVSDALLDDMRKATNGMVTDAELMRSGLQIMELGLADSQQGVVDLATVISALGLDMQQVIMTFANDSVMRLDALGLSVEKVTARAKELEAQGFIGDAFDQAVIEGLKDRMDVLGDSSETTAGKIQRLETAFTNFTEQAYGFVAERLTIYLDIADAIKDLNEGKEAFAETEKAAANAAGSYQEYVAHMLAAAKATSGMSDAQAKEYESIILLTDETTRYHAQLDIMTESQWNASEAQRENTSAITETTQAITENIYASQEMAAQSMATGAVVDMYAQKSQDAARANQYLGTQIRRQAEAQQSANSAMTVAGQKYSEINTGVYSLTQSLQDQLDFITAGGGALLELAQTAQDALNEGNFSGAQEALDMAAEGAIDLDLELGKIDPAEAVDRLMELGLGPEEAKARVAEFEASLFALTTRRWVVNVDMKINGAGGIEESMPPGSSGGPGSPPTELAQGTGGWTKVPGGFGQPYPVILHGGEDVNVGYGARNQSNAGVVYNNTYNNYTVNNELALRMAQEAQRRDTLRRQSQVMA